MGYTVPNLDKDVKEKDLKIVTRKRWPVLHQRNLPEEAADMDSDSSSQHFMK